jgi:hypothetical protein
MNKIFRVFLICFVLFQTVLYAGSWDSIDSLIKACDHINTLEKTKAPAIEMTEAYAEILNSTDEWLEKLTRSFQTEIDGKKYIDPLKVTDPYLEEDLYKKYSWVFASLEGKGNFFNTFIPLYGNRTKFLSNPDLKARYESDELLKSFKKRLLTNGLWISIEGKQEVLRLHPYFISTLITGKKPGAIARYETLMQYFSYDQALKTEDLNLSVFEFGQRIVAGEEYFVTTPKTPFKDHLEKQLLNYLKIWVGGRTKQYKSFSEKGSFYVVNPQLLMSLKDFINQYPKSKSIPYLKEIYDLYKEAPSVLSYDQVNSYRNWAINKVSEYRLQ